MKGKLILHAEQPLTIAQPLFKGFESIGVKVERRGYDLDGLSTKDETHLIWSMGHRLDAYRKLAQIQSVWFMENGWLSQGDGCSIDAVGSNGMSSVRGQTPPPLTVEKTLLVQQWISRLHKKNCKNRDDLVDYEYILVPLQTETDSNIRYWSCLSDAYKYKMVAFVDMVCEAFPLSNLVFRPHPRDPGIAEVVLKRSKGLKKHKHAEFYSVGTSYDWIKPAKAVVGINSTVLLEALTFLQKPVGAVGVGVFSEHGVMVEAKGSLERLRSTLMTIPDARRILAFLGLLYERQVPYVLHPDEYGCFPVLMDMLNHARS